MALKPCRECQHEISPEAKTCPNCGAKKPGWGRFAYAFPGLFALLIVGACAVVALSDDSFQWTIKPGESEAEWDRRLDASVEERIQCRDPSYLVRAVVADGGSYELIALEQSSITMCGWKTNLFEMFVVGRSGCVVQKRYRWQMNNVDAKRVRECFDGH